MVRKVRRRFTKDDKWDTIYIPAPTIINDGTRSYFKYRHISVLQTANKGLGLFVDQRKQLLPGLRIPFGGVEISAQQYTNLSKSQYRKPGSNSYTICDDSLKGSIEEKFYNGNPHLECLKNQPLYAWIGALANEPDPERQPNCFLVCGPAPPVSYPFTSTPIYVEVGDSIIRSGEELTVDYHYSDRARRSLNIQSGCSENKKPRYAPKDIGEYKSRTFGLVATESNIKKKMKRINRKDILKKARDAKKLKH